ncbi:MAG: ABC-F family ATP-binding cassette domain-containing protein [Dehalococcoidia bacterium]|nr:ABC-F family ATP-binding cassette domain-containing protein [Dehalococcoidia bacterium]
MALLTASQLGLQYGADSVFSGISLEVQDNAHIGIVGPNGVGKTSLLRVLIGETEASVGSVHRAKTARIGYVPQVPVLSTDGTLHDEIMIAFDEVRFLEEELTASAIALQDATPATRAQAEARYATLLERYQTMSDDDPESAVQRAAMGLGLNAQALATPGAVASSGERTRAALARALLSRPDILVLDEPTNHLDLQGLAWLDRYLSAYSRAFIAVSHDRYFLDKVATTIWELENGRLRSYPGNYTKYRLLKAEYALRQQREYDKQQEFIAKEESFIRRYRAGQRAAQAQGRQTRLNRLERVNAVQRERTVSMPTIGASHTALVVCATKDLAIGVATPEGARTLLQVPDMRVERGSRIGIIGENGIGKTTLLRTLLGQEPPQRGSATLGNGVNVGYYRQGLEDLPANLTVLDAFLQTTAMSGAEARSYLARFQFRGDDVDRRVGECSGGQRARLGLARLIVSQPNLLVMDEPTNHLDIPSRESLEDVLEAYDGTLIFVSHDRKFVSLLADQLWIARNGRIEVFDGTFEEWEEAEEEATKQLDAAAKRAKASRPTALPAQVAKPIARPVEPKPAPAPTSKPHAKTPAVDHENTIAELEAQLQSLEQQLQAAAEQNAFAAVTRLSREHAEARAVLEKAWAAWQA